MNHHIENAKSIPPPSEKSDPKHRMLWICIFLLMGILSGGQVNAQSGPSGVQHTCSFSQIQSSIPTVNLAESFGAGQLVTPWVDIIATHSCNAYFPRTMTTVNDDGLTAIGAFRTGRINLNSYKVNFITQILHPGHLIIEGASVVSDSRIDLI